MPKKWSKLEVMLVLLLDLTKWATVDDLAKMLSPIKRSTIDTYLAELVKKGVVERKLAWQHRLFGFPLSNTPSSLRKRFYTLAVGLEKLWSEKEFQDVVIDIFGTAVKEEVTKRVSQLLRD
jgi:predicted transcriptional regulator